MSCLPRSYLFVPGSWPERFAKAAATEAEALIIDLEDAVAEDQKDSARANVIAFLANRSDIHQKVVVRINPLGRASGIVDFAALLGAENGADYLLVPKAEVAAEIAMLDRALSDAGSTTQLAALIESAQGVVCAPEVARASSRLAFLMFGAADYAADLGQQVGVFRPEFARSAIVNAAAAGNIGAVDSPFFAINRPDDLRTECEHARAIGFHGKAAIHPAQIPLIAETFAPTEQDRAYARRILDAAPQGVGTLDGKMIDIAMIRWAERIV